MGERVSGVKASIGFASDKGPRERNEDFGGAVFGPELPQPRGDVVAAVADGIGGAKSGRVAAETAVRGFLDGFCDLPETMEVRRAGARVLNALNSWIYSEGKRNPEAAGLGCTFTALALRGRVAHVLHVGDTRAYRLGGDRLMVLTRDHVRDDGAGRSNILNRALGVETEVRLDYVSQSVARHDRFLLCSDGVHGFLTDDTIAEILRERSASEDTARALVAAALDLVDRTEQARVAAVRHQYLQHEAVDCLAVDRHRDQRQLHHGGADIDRVRGRQVHNVDHQGGAVVGAAVVERGRHQRARRVLGGGALA